MVSVDEGRMSKKQSQKQPKHEFIEAMKSGIDGMYSDICVT
jgi:hypothetical protein